MKTFKDYMTQAMAQVMEKEISEFVYCYFCGQNVKGITENSTRENLQWEINNKMHIKCYRKRR